MTTYIGIDPGVSGAVAAIYPGRVEVHDTPTVKVKGGTEYLVGEMEIMLSLLCSTGDAVAILEAGVLAGLGSKATFYKQGRGGGLWEGLLVGMGIPYEKVHPARWKKAMGVPADKAQAVVIAQQMFPHLAKQLLKSKDGRAEALLMAEYRRRMG